ncbi:signal peptidase I [Plantactinospora sp. B24E8]|uniref:signal peptidase I n=1 Tax=Plantactinospora sp. B24E8 TaxID=3153567 RepID=UPI00325E9667
MVRRVDEEDDVEPWRRRPRRSRRTRKQMPLWQELPLLLVVAFCLAVLIRTFLLQAFFIPSGSMEDTLLIGDRVLVNKIVYDLRDPVRGEIVVFRGTAEWAPQLTEEPDPGFVAKLGRTIGDLVGVSRPGDKDFIKRVVGLPGDRVRCCDDQGRVTVNDAPLDEPYVLENSPLDLPPNRDECRSRRFDEVVVPPGQLFVMGDHRLVSQDARCQGTVPIDNVIGRAFVIVWPLSHWTSLPVPDTFEDLPTPVAAPATLDAPGAGDGHRDGTPQTAPNLGDTAIAMPILGSLLVTQRSRRTSGTRRRRLHP